MAKTGHASTAARSYKRISDDKLCDLSDKVVAKEAKTADEVTPSTANTMAVSSCSDVGSVNVTINISK